MTAPYSQLSARAMVQAFARLELSPVEVTQAALDRIAAVNPQINAIYHLDAERALDSARASEQRWHGNEALGPLDGVPTTVKDALDCIGMPAYRGSAAGAVVVNTTDHPTVARMREAGSVILGKNTMCDYGILAGGVSSKHGVTRNPWDLSRTTGASSSGASASVAAGIEPLSIGTDIVGSIRLPASYCGLAGLKPSQGRVPYYVCNSPAITAGPLARSFGDVALHMNVLTGADGRDFTALARDGMNYVSRLTRGDRENLSVLVVPELGLGEPVAEDVRAALERTAQVLRDMGAQITYHETAPFSRTDWEPTEAFYKVRTLSELMRQTEDEQAKTPYIRDWSYDARALTAVEHQRNFDHMQSLRERALALIDGHDFVLLPSTPNTAFAAELPGSDPNKPFESWANTFLFNLTEQPASSIPVGLDRNGLPIGIQLVGNRFDDLGVLQMSWRIERDIGEMTPASL
ncbi:amidase family protein [Ruegeria sp. Ofav3-42]|uniref:amidase family protein n=1 Tax=Ruegeria sp. Ofav3-42 TaxID=2917759 RepID=UPI001EF4E7F6|nr:amidase family protein [Ruegeria sp. Ofav3-42]MCG7519904.1 amidase [Ruegeria sp. Ofav3-42]